MRILVISADGFRQPLDGVSRPLFEIVEGLSTNHDVETLIGVGEVGSEGNQIQLQGATGSLRSLDHARGHPSAWRKFAGRSRRDIQAQISARDFDVVVCYHSSTVYLVPDGLPVVLVGQDVLANLIARQITPASSVGRRLRLTLSAAYMRKVEQAAYRRSSAVTVVSAAEVKVAQQLYDVTPVVNPNGVGLCRPDPLTPRNRDGLVFVGNLSAPKNAAAAIDAARNIVPALRAREPNATLRIVGPGANDAVQQLNDLPGVTVVGPVDDLALELRGAVALIAPHEVATGIKNAVLDAMAHGLPVIGSSAVLGPIVGEVTDLAFVLDGTRSIDAIYADLGDPDAWQAMAERAYAHVRDHFSWQRYVAELEALCGHAVGS